MHPKDVKEDIMRNSSPAPRAAPQARISQRAVIGFATYLLLGPALLLLAGGDARWLSAWIYSALALVAVVGSRLLALKIAPSMLGERSRAMQAEDAPAWDRRLVFLTALLGPVLVLLLAGLDHRFAWPPPLALALRLAAGALLVLAYAFSTWAMLSNPFFSAVVRIQSERGHRVIRAGPYAWLRHPAYAGGILAMLAGPLMLDALWALIPAALVVAAMVLRTALEDRMLMELLPGYKDYAAAVRYRLVPGVW
jgi:protein-S-isoprenylcysteine O-methyltransferase Ste14